MPSALDWVEFGLGVGAAVLGSDDESNTRTQRQQEKPKQEYRQTVQQQQSSQTKVYPTRSSAPASPIPGRTMVGGFHPQQTTTTTTSTITPQPATVQPQQVTSKPVTPAKIQPKKVVPEEETFLLGFLNPLYNGDEEAIFLRIDGHKYNDVFRRVVIEELQPYSERAAAHKGYSSAKITRKSFDDGKVRMETTVTFNDGTSEDEVFYVVKNKSNVWRYNID
ncbi:hypothetical protein J6T93_01465 [bacterium]|nr:hypothetical protein [bacterium]